MAALWLWVGFTLFVLLLLALDLGLLHRRDQVISARHALMLSVGYVTLALLFAAGVFTFLGRAAGVEFLTGYLIEKSLSVDNVFVFVLVFTHFAVPPQYQYRVLFWGVLGALVMRATLILAGAAVIDAFEWVLYLFGLFLIVTGARMLVTVGREPDIEHNRVVAFIRRRFNVTQELHGSRFFVVRDGTRYVTPLFVVLVLVELTDVVFALDSIPAIFAVTRDPFIVYTSNVFAILGLRALYFAIAGVIQRFHYLEYGLSLVLLVIGAKMILNEWFGRAVVSTELALLLTAALVGVSMLVSVWKTRRLSPDERRRLAERWWVPGSPPRPDRREEARRPQ